MSKPAPTPEHHDRDGVSIYVGDLVGNIDDRTGEIHRRGIVVAIVPGVLPIRVRWYRSRSSVGYKPHEIVILPPD